MCAAVSASRKGVNVALIERRDCLGGKVSSEVKFPFDSRVNPNFFFQRESGLLDELLSETLSENVEGTYAGQARAFRKWVTREKRIRLFLKTQAYETEMNEGGDKIISLQAISHLEERRYFFFARFFVDCSGIGALVQFSGAPGERGEDLSALESETHSISRVRKIQGLVCMRVGKSNRKVPYSCPDWIRIKWEDNSLAARLEWIKSLNDSLLGDHLLEWSAPAAESPKEGEEIAWAAWDYLKNRSPMKDAASNLIVEDVSSGFIRSDVLRGRGDYELQPEDFINGVRFPDSIAVGRSFLDGGDSLLSSDAGKICLPSPFEIPLRCLYSRKVKNLFWAGEHASCSSRLCSSLRHPPTAAQMGVAAGFCAATCVEKRRLPRTMAKFGYVDQIRRELSRLNHAVSVQTIEDLENLCQDAAMTASSCLSTWNLHGMNRPLRNVISNSFIVQFPACETRIEKVGIMLEFECSCKVDFRLLLGSGHFCSFPGNCIYSTTISISQSSKGWFEINPNCEIRRKGWVYLEISSSAAFSIPLQPNSPPGILLSRKKENWEKTIANSFGEHLPILPKYPGPASGPILEITPHQQAYEPAYAKNLEHRPTSLPNLWISQPTSFRYPEFLELKWQEEKDISVIEICFDSSYAFSYADLPEQYENRTICSLVKEYKLYYLDGIGRYHQLAHEVENIQSFRHHSFAMFKAHGLELEILSTNGIDRAQVHEIRVY